MANVSNRLSQTANIIHQKLRTSERKDKIQMLRRNALSVLNSNINTIIQKSNKDKSDTMIDDLALIANNDNSNAIVQIGNLILDDNKLADLFRRKLELGKNDYWSWLLRIFLECGVVFTIVDLVWLYEAFCDRNKNAFVISNIAECLAKLTQDITICGQLIISKVFLQTVAKYCFSIQESIYIPCFRILSNIVSVDKNLTHLLVHNIKNLTSIIKIGLQKSETNVRTSAATIISNLALDGLTPIQLSDIIILKSTKQKTPIIQELSYFFVNVSEFCDFEVVDLFVERGLVETVFFYQSSDDRVLEQNGTKIVKNILQRLLEGKKQESFNMFYRSLQNYEIIQSLKKRHSLMDDQVLQFLLKN